jgi:Domain of unknown function (DUF6265)
MKPGQTSPFFKTIVLFLLIVFVIACNNEVKKEDKADVPAPAEKGFNFDQLLGTWQNEDGKSFERWTKKENNNYESVSFTVKGTDTVNDESVKIYAENGNWIYEATVKGQNDGKAVKFTSSILTEHTVQFSNPTHDFPTDVNYTLTDANTVQAFIVGPNKQGGKDTIPFRFTRVK